MVNFVSEHILNFFLAKVKYPTGQSEHNHDICYGPDMVKLKSKGKDIAYRPNIIQQVHQNGCKR